MACQLQLADMVDMFVEHFGEALLEAVDPIRSNTPLLMAVRSVHCNRQFVRHMLAKGADPRAENGGQDVLLTLLQEGLTKEKIAVMSELIDLLGTPMADRSDLLEATARLSYAPVQQLAFEMFDLLVEKGVKVPRHETAIISRAVYSREAVEFYLDKGVHIDARLENEPLPLHSVIHLCQTNSSAKHVIEFLLEKGANPNALGQRGAPACFEASPNIELIEILVKNGADLNLINSEGVTLLFHVLVNDMRGDDITRYYTLARQLVRLGADPAKCVDADGRDPCRHILDRWISPLLAPAWLALLRELGVPFDYPAVASHCYTK